LRRWLRRATLTPVAPLSLSPRTLDQLRAVFGDCVPRTNADAILAASPAAPTTLAELEALHAVLPEAAGKKLSQLVGGSAGGSAGALAPTSTQGRPLPANTSLRLAQVQAARDLRTADGLTRVLTEKKAAALFNTIAAMPDIPHRFLEDGCLHRTHVIGKRLEEMGIFSEKCLVIPLAGDLVMDTPKARLGYTVVWYHEAIAVHVQTKNGLERRVLDPSVGDAPMTVEEWSRTMRGARGDPLEIFYLPRFAFGLSARDQVPTAYRDEDLADALDYCRDGWREVERGYEEMGFYDGGAAELAGRGRAPDEDAGPGASSGS
jgi:hypothetical protein